MNIIGRYILRSATGAFLAALVVLTGVVWITQALREIDVLTTQGQTLWLFLYLTMLALPALIMVIAPVALFIACLYVLNKLNADSELAVIHAAGIRPWHVAKPILCLAGVVTLLTALISVVIMPESARTLRDLTTQIRADLLTFMIVEGRFRTVDDGLTFHVRRREPDGTLRGLMVHDARDAEQATTYLAEDGHILREGNSAYLVMEQGSIHQGSEEPGEMSIVTFDRYVFDLSSLTQSDRQVHYHPREMRLSELVNPADDNIFYARSPGRFRAELHERLSSILYPLAFALVSLATLGRPRTNRQGRGKSMLAAIVVVAGARTVGFGATNLAVTQPLAVIPMYAAPLVVIAVCLRMAFAQQSGAFETLVRKARVPAGAVAWSSWPGLARLQHILGAKRSR